MISQSIVKSESKTKKKLKQFHCDRLERKIEHTTNVLEMTSSFRFETNINRKNPNRLLWCYSCPSLDEISFSPNFRLFCHSEEFQRKDTLFYFEISHSSGGSFWVQKISLKKMYPSTGLGLSVYIKYMRNWME